MSLFITHTHLSVHHDACNNTNPPKFLSHPLWENKPTSVPVKFLMKTQAHLSSCHVTYDNTSTSASIMLPMTTQAHLIMLLVITQDQPSSHHVAYDNISPRQHPSVAFGNKSPRTIAFLWCLLQKFPVFYSHFWSLFIFQWCNMFLYSTQTKYSSHIGTIIYCRTKGLPSFNPTCSLNNERCTFLWNLQPISESTHKITPIYCVILTDRHNQTDLKNWFWLSTSAIIRSASVHKNNKKGEASPNMQWCKIVIKLQ